MQRRDAIVIGAGLNGLVAGAYLARAGVNVLVLERSDRAGGTETLHEFAPGFHASRFLLRASALNPRIVADLDLASHGLKQFDVDAGVSLFRDGKTLAHYADRSVHFRELARFSLRDADAFTRFHRDMRKAARAIAPYLGGPMPDIRSYWPQAIRNRFSLASLAAEKSIADLYDVTRLWSASTEDLLSDYFHSEEVRAHYAMATLAGATLGPQTATSGLRLLLPYLKELEIREGGDPRMVSVASGPGGTVSALVSCIKSHGGELRFEAEVTDVVLKSGRATGVVLADGEEISANMILSELDLKRSFLSLFKWKDLPDDLAERVSRMRLKGVTAKLNLALESAPEFPDVPKGCPSLRGGVRLVNTIADMDDAYDDWRSNVLSQNPPIFVDVPSWYDPMVAPQGKHVMSVLVQFVPLAMHDADWDEARREAFIDRTLDQLERHSPGLKSRIIARQLWLANDMEDELGQTSGDLAQGELTLDQMFFTRPLPGMGGYTTPIRDFYLCSNSAHPGPLTAGGAGANAARSILRLNGRDGQK